MRTLHIRRKMSLSGVCSVILAQIAILPEGNAQSLPPAGKSQRLEFDVASVRPTKAGCFPQYNIFPDGTVYKPTGGVLSMYCAPLGTLIAFAYDVGTGGFTSRMLAAQLPKSATTDRFSIQAKSADANVTKAQLRLMMKSLLADRFRLAVHTETRQLPVLTATLAKPGKLGPGIRPHSHSDEDSCAHAPEREAGAPPPPEAHILKKDGFTPLCHQVLQVQDRGGPGNLSGRDIPIKEIVESLSDYLIMFSGEKPRRPLLDRTGLTGNFDFIVTYETDAGPPPPGATPDRGPDTLPGPALESAIKSQLGFKLVRQDGPVDVLVVDHVEYPSEN